MPKTLAEIAIEASLVTKANAAKAGRMAEERKLPLVVVLIRDLGIDEVALIGALRKQTRVQLLDPAEIQIDADALRLVGKDVCARLRVLPISVSTDGPTRTLRLAMADPTDESAVAEIEALVRCEIEVCALPLSAIEELVDKGYRQISTVVVNRSRPFGDNMFVTARTRTPTRPGSNNEESEVSVTAQIPMSMLQPPAGATELEARFAALCRLLVTKGLVSEAELVEAMAKAKPEA